MEPWHARGQREISDSDNVAMSDPFPMALQGVERAVQERGGHGSHGRRPRAGIGLQRGCRPQNGARQASASGSHERSTCHSQSKTPSRNLRPRARTRENVILRRDQGASVQFSRPIHRYYVWRSFRAASDRVTARTRLVAQARLIEVYAEPLAPADAHAPAAFDLPWRKGERLRI